MQTTQAAKRNPSRCVEKLVDKNFRQEDVYETSLTSEIFVEGLGSSIRRSIKRCLGTEKEAIFCSISFYTTLLFMQLDRDKLFKRASAKSA